MTPDDLVILFSATLIVGYISGFMTVKVNHILIIILGKLWSSGHAQQRYIPIGVSTCAFYYLIIPLLFNNMEFAISLASVSLFATSYVAGIREAEKRFKQSLDIMDEIIQAMYPSNKSNVTEGNRTSVIALGILEAMQGSNVEALKFLFFFFDSATAVFFISLSTGKFRCKRFINLSHEEQMDYLEAWADNQYLFYAIRGMKSLIGFSYYTSPKDWKEIGYKGKLLQRSYWN